MKKIGKARIKAGGIINSYVLLMTNIMNQESWLFVCKVQKNWTGEQFNKNFHILCTVFGYSIICKIVSWL